jgi:hypothetical protein
MGYDALLSGATGALGLGGGGSVGAAIPSGPSSSASSQSGDISPTVSGISGGATDLRQTVNIAFPSAKLSSSADINPPLLSGFNLLWVAIGVGALIFVLVIYRN